MKPIALILMLALAACQTTQTTGSSETSQLNRIVSAIKAACGFVPAAKTILALLGKNIPYGEIISSVCVAAGATAGDPAHASHKAHGVIVQGHFVK